MDEGEAWVAFSQLVPELPYPEIALAHVHVVEQDDTPVAELREPALEVPLDGLIGVVPVDVQEIDGGVAEVCERLVERTLAEARAGTGEGVVTGSQPRPP